MRGREGEEDGERPRAQPGKKRRSWRVSDSEEEEEEEKGKDGKKKRKGRGGNWGINKIGCRSSLICGRRKGKGGREAMEGGKGGKERREEEKGRMGWPRILKREGLKCNIFRAWEEGGECGGKASPETPKRGESLMISTNNDQKDW